MNESLKTGQPEGDATNMPRGINIPDERRAVLDQFVTMQFVIDSVSGIKVAKRTWERFEGEARQFVGCTPKYERNDEFRVRVPTREFHYLKWAFNHRWAGLSPAGRRAAEAKEIAAQQQAARKESERLKSMNAEEFLKKSYSPSAKCQLAYIRLEEWQADQNPDTLQCARQLFQEAADAGNFEALFSLGCIVVLPPGAGYMSPPPSVTYLEADERKRRDYIKRAADAGYKEAIDFLGRERGDRLADDFDLEMYEAHDAEERSRAEEPYWRQQEGPGVPDYRAKAAQGDLDAIVRLADWLIGSAGDIRRRWPSERSKEEIEINEYFGFETEPVDPMDEQMVTDYLTDARNVLEDAEKFGDPRILWLLASTNNFGLEDERQLELLQKAAFPENDKFKPNLKAVDELARRRYEAGEFDEAERCLRLLIAHGKAPDDSEFRLAKLYEKTGDFAKAEQSLRDHIRNRKAPDRAEIGLARLIRSHLSDAGARHAEALALLEDSAEFDAEAAMLAGLMQLRGEGCEGSRKEAKKHFDQCKKIQELPGHARHISPTADYVDLALALGWGEENSLYYAAEELLKLADSSGFKGTNVPGPTGCEIHGITNKALKQQGAQRAIQFDALQFSLDDAHTLQEGNAAFAAIDELNSLRPEFGQVDATWLLQLESLLAAVLSEVRFEKNGVIATVTQKVTDIERCIPKNSMVWSFFVGQLMLAGRVEDATYSDAVTLFERVNQFGAQFRETERDGEPNHRGYKTLRFWLHEKTQRALHHFRDMRDAEEKAARQREIERAREEEQRDMLSFLSHTLINATTGGADEVREIAGRLARLQATVDLSDEAARLAAETSRMAMVEGLVNVFKQYASDPKALSQMWAQDEGGKFSVLQVAALAIRQSLLRFYFSTVHENDFQRLMPRADYASLAHEFMADVAVLDMNLVDDVQRLLQWIQARLPFLQLDMEGLASMQLKQGGARAIVVFSLVGEFLANALKYAAANSPIMLTVVAESDGLRIACSNTLVSGLPPPVLGGRTGLAFVRKVCELIGAKFDEPAVANDSFILNVLLPIK